MTRVLVVTALLPACGGDDEAGGGAYTLPEQSAASLCEDACVRAVDCGWEESQAQCELDCVDAAGFLRGDVMEYIVDCHEQLSCDEAQDVCEERAEDEFTPTGTHEAIAADCEARLTDCGLGDSLAGELCDPDGYEFVAEDAIARLESCFEPESTQCDEIGACIDEATEDWGD